MPRERKQFPLRVPQELYDVYEAWAADEFRSVNAQIEAVLVDAARRAGRLRRRPGGGQGRGATSAEDPT
jgi:hypothetical protein